MVQTSVVVQLSPSLHAVPVVGAQVPSLEAPAATEHAWQSPVAPPPHAVAQHTPSTQKPLPHCAALVQSEPAARVDTSSHVSAT